MTHRIDCDMDEDCNCPAGEQPVLRAMTFRQPWLSFVLGNAAAFPGVGSKWIENRPRGPGRLLGTVIALHNGLGLDDLPESMHALCAPHPHIPLPDFPPGHIVGLARVVGNVGPKSTTLWGGKSRFATTDQLLREAVKSPWRSKAPGNHAWALDERLILPRPVPCSGNQIYGWAVPPDVAAQVFEQVALR